MNSRRKDAITGFAAIDAAITSSWVRGDEDIPAAKFEMSESPATFMPQAFANTASGTVLMPTMSAPM